MSTSKEKLGPPWTTLKILTWTIGYFEKHGLDNPRVDAEFLLSHALGLERIMLYAHFDRPLERDELDRFRAMVKRRAQHEPVAYITGERGFWSIDLKTDARALIPRPDTETLVEQALERLPEGAARRVVDVGTGSGAIALAIAHDRPEVEVAATDVSAEALALARENAEALSLTDRVTLLKGDLLDALPGGWRDPAPDMIVSNPPYVGEGERDVMGQDVLAHEPHQALFAGEDGLDILRRLVPQSFEALTPGGWLLCEMGYRQGEAVRALFEQSGFEQVELYSDLGGNERVVAGQKPA